MRSMVATTLTSPVGSTRMHADGDPNTIAAAASMIAPFFLTPCVAMDRGAGERTLSGPDLQWHTRAN